jgi:hypothetical protein
MSTQLGNSVAVVWGSNVGVSYTSGTVGAGDNLTQSTNFGKGGDEAEIRDTEGEVQSHITYNKTETLEIEVIPIGTSISDAQGNNICPEKGELVTLTNSAGGHSELVSTSWICMSANQSASNTSEVRISMSLKKYDRALTAIS